MNETARPPAKEAIRTAMRERRRAYPPAAAAAAGAAAQGALLGLPEFAAARTVCCYLALPGEVATDLILAACRRAGRAVLAPVYRPGTRDYGLAFLAEGRPLAPGPGGVPEPRDPDWADGAAPDFWVVPGLAFDAAGGRLGHGRGHYDRLLASTARPGFRAGLAFSWQLVPEAPMTPRDVRLDAVVTEAGVFRRPGPPEATT